LPGDELSKVVPVIDALFEFNVGSDVADAGALAPVSAMDPPTRTAILATMELRKFLL
jgi:hypothetical protein